MHRCTWLLAALAAAALASGALADSPITSTYFAEAYSEDYAMVKAAEESGAMTLEIAQYLADPETPIDVKAAVVNALSWEFEGKSNAETYCEMRFPDADGIPSPRDVSGEDALVIGYLQVMDNYFEPAEALPMLIHARRELPESFTVAMVHTLCECQRRLDDVQQWDQLWTLTEEVVNDEELNGDMRLGAVRIIVDYMSIYGEE
jgi:hypothetical protein